MDIDRLGLLIKQWEAVEVAALINEYNSDKDKETTVWNPTEKYLIDLNAKKNFEKKVKIWLF